MSYKGKCKWGLSHWSQMEKKKFKEAADQLSKDIDGLVWGSLDLIL